MKKMIYTLFVMLLVGCLVAMGQIKPIKRQHSTKQKTEKTLDMKKVSSSNSSKSKRTDKTVGQNPSKRSNLSNHFHGMTQAQRDRIIKQAIDDMVWVGGWTFMMGATFEQGSDADRNEKPTHQVKLNGYFISKYEVTQELWLVVMENNPSNYTISPLNPVDGVTWYDCQMFLRKLNQLTGKCFRLPTEAEWEFAARGGIKGLGYKYSGGNKLGDVAWYINNSGGTTHPVGQKSPNELGLYDMSGNVLEWCQDWFGNYSNNYQRNPTGPSENGGLVVLRGGNCVSDAKGCRVSRRYDYDPSIGNGRGLRLAMSSK